MSAALVLGLGCAPTETGSGDAGTALTEWIGEEPHFRATGTLDGEDLDLALEGDAGADGTKLYCEREYVVPLNGTERDYANGALVEVKLHAFVSVGGEEREAVIEFKKHDMSADAAGTKITVAPRNDAEDPAAGSMYLEWEWVSADGADLYEESAQTGSVTVEQFSGEPDAETGLLIPEGEGQVGVFFTADWSETETVTVSATAPCTTNIVEEVQ